MARTPSQGDPPKLSYKFQRVREAIRKMIASGELTGELPGERALAKQFSVNAKTLGKALNDLAAEGLIERRVGAGSFVRTGRTTTGTARPMLLAVRSDALGLPVVQQLLKSQRFHLLTDTPDPLPSQIGAASVVVSFRDALSDDAVRNLEIRGINVLQLGPPLRRLSVRTVIADMMHCAQTATRHLLRSGHRHLALVFDQVSPEIDEARQVIEQTIRSFDRDGSLVLVDIDNRAALESEGFSAALTPAHLSQRLLGALCPRPVNRSVEVMGIGCSPLPPAVNGVYVTPERKARSVLRLIDEGLSHRPATLWIAGELIEVKTNQPTAFHPAVEAVGDLQPAR